MIILIKVSGASSFLVGVRVLTCDELSEPHFHINREVIPIIGLPVMALDVGHEGDLDFR